MQINGNEVSLNHQPSGGKSWIAKIVGKHPKYNFDRRFLNKSHFDYSSSGKTGTDYYTITEDGFYEVSEAWKKNRYYLKCENGVVSKIEFNEVVV